MPKNRTIETVIKKVDGNFKALLLTGMRQVGKTTVLQSLADNNRTYITLFFCIFAIIL
jgi:predicted AAA+ superfamily ATPase